MKNLYSWPNICSSYMLPILEQRSSGVNETDFKLVGSPSGNSVEITVDTQVKTTVLRSIQISTRDLSYYLPVTGVYI